MEQTYVGYIFAVGYSIQPKIIKENTTAVTVTASCIIRHELIEVVRCSPNVSEVLLCILLISDRWLKFINSRENIDKKYN